MLDFMRKDLYSYCPLHKVYESGDIHCCRPQWGREFVRAIDNELINSGIRIASAKILAMPRLEPPEPKSRSPEPPQSSPVCKMSNPPDEIQTVDQELKTLEKLLHKSSSIWHVELIIEIIVLVSGTALALLSKAF
jgi:hypothetical protein